MKNRMKRKKKWVQYLVCFCLCAIVLLPLMNIVQWMVMERLPWPQFFPTHYSLRGVGEIFRRRRETVELFVSSIGISTAVAMVSCVIGMMTARALLVYQFRGRQFFFFLTILPFMVPATVFGMGIQFYFIQMGLNNTVLGVILCHVLLSLPYCIQIIMSGMRALGTRLEEQARVLGAGSYRAFFVVTLPLLIPVLLPAWSMAYIVSFSQYFITLLIGGGRVKTFTIVMMPYLQSGNRNIASVYSVLFLLLNDFVFFIFTKLAQVLNRKNGGAYYEA